MIDPNHHPQVKRNTDGLTRRDILRLVLITAPAIFGVVKLLDNDHPKSAPAETMSLNERVGLDFVILADRIQSIMQDHPATQHMPMAGDANPYQDNLTIPARDSQTFKLNYALIMSGTAPKGLSNTINYVQSFSVYKNTQAAGQKTLQTESITYIRASSGWDVIYKAADQEFPTVMSTVHGLNDLATLYPSYSIDRQFSLADEAAVFNRAHAILQEI